MKGLPREKLFIQTKTRAKDAEAAKADIDRFRQELGVDYLDSLLMHCMTTKALATDMRPVMDVLSEAKAEGHRARGGRFVPRLRPAGRLGRLRLVDVQLARINPFGDKMDGKPDDVAGADRRRCTTRAAACIGMKIYGETGFDSAEKRWSR